MKAVMKSVSPRICEKVANGDCTLLVSKTAPKQVPFKCYIYVTKGKPYLYRVDDDNNFELTNTLRPKTFEYVKDYNEQNGKIIGEFVCDKVERLEYQEKYLQGITSQTAIKYFSDKIKSTALSVDELMNYGNGKPLYGWHISNLKIYDKPKELREFFKPCPTKEKGDCLDCDCLADNDYGGICTNNLTRPPQSWCYVEE